MPRLIVAAASPPLPSLEHVGPVTSGAPSLWAYGLEQRRTCASVGAVEQGRARCDACRKDVAPLCDCPVMHILCALEPFGR